jgi:hypothetical protein
VEAPTEHFEYENPDEKHFAVLRCIRIVSDFRTIMLLLSRGYVQQIGVLMRGILEFNHDLDVIIAAAFIDSEMKPAVDERMSHFFSDPRPDALEIIRNPKKKPTIPRKKLTP